MVNINPKGELQPIINPHPDAEFHYLPYMYASYNIIKDIFC